MTRPQKLLQVKVEKFKLLIIIVVAPGIIRYQTVFSRKIRVTTLAARIRRMTRAK